jgi:hypothetical protein
MIQLEIIPRMFPIGDLFTSMAKGNVIGLPIGKYGSLLLFFYHVFFYGHVF